MFDFSNTNAPQERGGLIPDGTVAVVRMMIKKGGVGPDNWFTRSKSGNEMLAAEFTVLEGDYQKRKFWEYFITNDSALDSSGMVQRSMDILRGIVDSANGLSSEDKSPMAQAKRAEIGKIGAPAFHGVCFLAKIGVEPGKPKPDGSGEKFADKNRLVIPVTIDRKEWNGHAPIQQPPLPAGAMPSSPPPQNPSAPNGGVPTPDWGA